MLQLDAYSQASERALFTSLAAVLVPSPFKTFFQKQLKPHMNWYYFGFLTHWESEVG